MSPQSKIMIHLQFSSDKNTISHKYFIITIDCLRKFNKAGTEWSNTLNLVKLTSYWHNLVHGTCTIVKFVPIFLLPIQSSYPKCWRCNLNHKILKNKLVWLVNWCRIYTKSPSRGMLRYISSIPVVNLKLKSRTEQTVQTVFCGIIDFGGHVHNKVNYNVPTKLTNLCMS